MEKKVKLKDAIELGKECGLNSVEECVSNIEIHAMNLFPYKKINEECRFIGEVNSNKKMKIEYQNEKIVDLNIGKLEKVWNEGFFN